MSAGCAHCLGKCHLPVLGPVSRNASVTPCYQSKQIALRVSQNKTDDRLRTPKGAISAEMGSRQSRCTTAIVSLKAERFAPIELSSAPIDWPLTDRFGHTR